MKLPSGPDAGQRPQTPCRRIQTGARRGFPGSAPGPPAALLSGCSQRPAPGRAQTPGPAAYPPLLSGGSHLSVGALLLQRGQLHFQLLLCLQFIGSKHQAYGQALGFPVQIGILSFPLLHHLVQVDLQRSFVLLAALQLLLNTGIKLCALLLSLLEPLVLLLQLLLRLIQLLYKMVGEGAGYERNKLGGEFSDGGLQEVASLVEHSRLSLTGLDLGTQVLSLSFQLAHNVLSLLQQSLQVLDLLVLVSNLTQHLLQRLQLLVLLLGFLQLVLHLGMLHLQLRNLFLQLPHLLNPLYELRAGLLQGGFGPRGPSLELLNLELPLSQAALSALLGSRLSSQTLVQFLRLDLHQLLLQYLHILHSRPLQLGGRTGTVRGRQAPPRAPFLLLARSIGPDGDCCSPEAPAREKGLRQFQSSGRQEHANGMPMLRVCHRYRCLVAAECGTSSSMANPSIETNTERFWYRVKGGGLQESHGDFVK
ncbi:hypothetical protein EYF80_032369 [Liparis tanakae]|uniref:Uncharacterized protein n=1 Tax=Liparis tanakae TaxID=230148 RepID=A0A4Z2GVZ4_9TELE|nr:hypothetical protein EYF80_032369 [Liparis tanakae]